MPRTADPLDACNDVLDAAAETTDPETRSVDVVVDVAVDLPTDVEVVDEMVVDDEPTAAPVGTWGAGAVVAVGPSATTSVADGGVVGGGGADTVVGAAAAAGVVVAGDGALDGVPQSDPRSGLGV